MRYPIVFLKSFGIVFVGSIVGFLLLMVVFTLPTEKMESHVRESVHIFQKEDTYPKIKIINWWHRTRLDNFTDALMLLTASYSGEASLLNKAIDCYRLGIPKNSPNKSLCGIYSDNTDANNKSARRISYGRYWHGYLVILKPLLALFNYRKIRLLNAALVFLTTVALLTILYKKNMKKFILPYVITLLLIDPVAVSKSLQYSSVFYISTLSSIVVLLRMNKWGLDKFILFFVAVGCMTSYCDLLTYPLVSFGIPAIFYFSGDNEQRGIKAAFLLLVGWGFGYVSMWAAKWIIGTVLGTSNIIENAYKAITFRASMSWPKGKSFTHFAVLNRNFRYLMNPMLIVGAMYTIVGVVNSLRTMSRFRMSGQKQDLLTFLFIALLPFAWYMGASNHSYIHSWMTYREFCITIFALMCLVAKNQGIENAPRGIDNG